MNQGMSKTIFERIIAREIPANIIYEDEHIVAFMDIKPVAPTHVLIIPRKPIARLEDVAPDDHAVLGHLLMKAPAIAAQLGLTESGYRLVINNGQNAGQEVPHLHLHLIGGRRLAWPPG
jgi:histidine triad (HIT) family protein